MGSCLVLSHESHNKADSPHSWTTQIRQNSDFQSSIFSFFTEWIPNSQIMDLDLFRKLVEALPFPLLSSVNGAVHIVYNYIYIYIYHLAISFIASHAGVFRMKNELP